MRRGLIEAGVLNESMLNWYPIMATAALAYIASMALAALYLRGEISFGTNLPFSRNPLHDIDLSASTDFEDGLVVAVDSIFLAEQDASVWADGTSFYAWRSSDNIISRADLAAR